METITALAFSGLCYGVFWFWCAEGVKNNDLPHRWWIWVLAFLFGHFIAIGIYGYHCSKDKKVNHATLPVSN